jgi:Cysteine-rich secretory protein family
MFSMSILLLGTSAIAQDEKYNKSKEKILKFISKKKYYPAHKLTSKTLQENPNDTFLNLAMAYTLYYARIHKKIKKRYPDKEHLLLTQMKYLEKAKPASELRVKAYFKAVQRNLQRTAERYVKADNFIKAKKFYGLLFDYFNDTTGVYENFYAEKSQDYLFKTASDYFFAEKYEKAKTIFNWMYKKFNGNPFPLVYVGTEGLSDTTYLFDVWRNPIYVLANTAKNAHYMSPDEKELIYLHNLIRMNRELFLSTFIMRYASIYGYGESDSYFQSLISDMKQAKSSFNLAYPHEGLYRAAEYHANDLGKTGEIGHASTDGSSPWGRIRRFAKGVSGNSESCSYGPKYPIGIFFLLLIDRGVESLGHRKNIMSAGNSKIGIAIRPHLTYGWNCVLDYGN